MAESRAADLEERVWETAAAAAAAAAESERLGRLLEAAREEVAATQADLAAVREENNATRDALSQARCCVRARSCLMVEGPAHESWELSLCPRSHSKFYIFF